MHVKIISDGTPRGTKVLTADGSPVTGLTGIIFRADIDDVNRAELSLSCALIDAEASARVFVNGREVRRIEYADGTVEEFPAS
jgi:hypothetical protein